MIGPANERAWKISGEKLFVGAVILCQCLLLAHSVHTAWFEYSAQAALAAAQNVASPASAASVPVLYAPDAYRVGMPFLGGIEAQLLHLRDSTWIAALNDFGFGLGALFLLYGLAAKSRTSAPGTQAARMARLLVFFALIQFPLAWIVPWQRPETMPACCFLAFALFALEQTEHRPRWVTLLLSATVLQAFARADVPFIFGVALALLGAARILREPHNGDARENLATGVGVFAIAGGVQAYLQFVRFPHLSYSPGIHPFQLVNNLKSVHNLVTFVTALAPLALVVGYTLRQPIPLGASEKLILLASGLYLAMWWTVGSIGEVRLFVPFMMLLCVFAARTLPGSLLGGKTTESCAT